MGNEPEIDESDMMPQPASPPAPDAMEQAQKDAAEERLQGGGYGG